MPADIAKELIEAGVAIPVKEKPQDAEELEEAIPAEVMETTATRRSPRRSQAAIKPED